MNTGTLRQEIEELLIDEYWLLDNDQFEDWLKLMSPEIRYWGPVREDLDRGEEDFFRPHLLTHFDEDYGAMSLRVARLRTEFAYAERPPSRIRHFVSNVKVLEAIGTLRVHVASNFIVFRSRAGREETIFVGTRRDWWIRSDEGWRLTERMIIFDHGIMDNITIFV